MGSGYKFPHTIPARMDGDPRPSWQSIKDQQAVQQKLLVLLCFHGNLWIGKSMTRDEDTSPVLPLSHPTCPRDTEPPTAWSSFPGEEGCSLKNKHLQQFIPKKHVFIFNWRRVGQHPRKGCIGSGNQRGTDRQTDSQDSMDPSSPSQTISPELSRHTELSGTSRADPALPGGQQPGSTPTGAVCSPRISQAPIPGVFQAGIAGGARQIPARPHLPRHNHRVLEPERNLGGGRGAILQGKDPTAGAAWAWQSIKATQIPSLASQTFLTPAAASSRCSGNFFSKLGRKSLWDRDNQKAAGSGSEPPPRSVAWDGDAGRETGTPRGDQGCWGGDKGCQKPRSRAMSRAGAAVPWAGGMKRVMRTQSCKNQLHWTLGTAPQRMWSRPSPCIDTHIYPILRALRVTLKESLKES